MITVDPREGSGKLLPKLESRGVMVRSRHLPFGDLQFFGEGRFGEPQNIGVEVKTLNEFLGDILDPRFTGHQMLGMLEVYDRSYLIIEGKWKANPGGQLLVPRGFDWKPAQVGAQHEISYSQFRKKLITLEECAHVTPILVDSQIQLLREVVTLYHWWVTGFDHHGSLRVFYQPPSPSGLKRPTRYRQALERLCEGVGWTKTAAIEKSFPTMACLVHANIEDIAKVQGIGPKLANTIYRALHD